MVTVILIDQKKYAAVKLKKMRSWFRNPQKCSPKRLIFHRTPKIQTENPKSNAW